MEDIQRSRRSLPPGLRRSLIDARFDVASCGVGFVATTTGVATHAILQQALTGLARLAHRGAVAADGLSSDGVGVMTAVPRALLVRACGLTPADDTVLGVGVLFAPEDDASGEDALREALGAQGLAVLGWRDVPVERDVLGRIALGTMPQIRQVLVVSETPHEPEKAVERKLYLARKQFERMVGSGGATGYVASLSCRTIVYKGMCSGTLLPQFYPDLQALAYVTPFAIFHQRYATNTEPTWDRAQPVRMLAHNGEINTIWGNRARMAARDATLPAECKPILTEGGTDSTSLDEAVELLARNGRTISEAVRILMPPAADPRRVSTYLSYHADCVEPWDGPAAIAFSDGRVVGAALDRNGLRPCRFAVTSDGLVVAGSEAGLVDLDPERVTHSGRLGPGQMLVVDLVDGRVYEDEELLRVFDASAPYATLKGMVPFRPAITDEAMPATAVQVLQRSFGYTREDVRMVLEPMARDGKDPVWSMGDDTPLAALAHAPRPVYGYFRQRFAQVTNPAIDPLREAVVVSLGSRLGPWSHMLDKDAPLPGMSIASPMLSLEHVAALRSGAFPQAAELPVAELACVFGVDGTLEGALTELCAEAIRLTRGGARVLLLSDRSACVAGDEVRIPVPMALATGAVHHALVEAGIRTDVGLAVEAGDCRDIHHAAILIGYGAGAVCPWLALETAKTFGGAGGDTPGLKPVLSADRKGTLKGPPPTGVQEPASSEGGMGILTGFPPTGARERIVREGAGAAEKKMLQSFDAGLAKIMSKMGISVVDSYRDAHLFDILGLGDEVVGRCFAGTPSPLGGVGFAAIERGLRLLWAPSTAEAHVSEARHGAPDAGAAGFDLPDFGWVRFRKSDTAEPHAWQPGTVKALQTVVGSTRAGVLPADARAAFAIYTEGQQAGSASGSPAVLRDLLAIRAAGPAIGVEAVEPAEAMYGRFVSSAMSLGSLSPEAHTCVTEAMNMLGGRSNTGEGGEDPEVYRRGADGAWNLRNNRIKQVASGRFGVTAEYLAHADEIEIKVAQGAKPGEGGQLPGHKVSGLIARLRHSQPGVSLISPPPHHDIYSIEDLAQLIYDLKRVNPRAAVGVKLVSRCGVGTVAAGVAKAFADFITIAGHGGGTGAAALSSIKYAGNPWELGLAEAQQVLVANGMRGRVRLRTDGGLATARDVLVAALLGADEFAFGTAVLVAIGCDMARQCHLNTCPTGIATQRPELRAKFRGKPEHVVRFFAELAEDLRRMLARYGLASLEEATGRVDLLEQVRADGGLNLGPMLFAAEGDARRWQGGRNTEAGRAVDEVWVAEALVAVEAGRAYAVASPIANRDRAVGARLAGELALRRAQGPVNAEVSFELTGTAGQSFGAFAVEGMRLTLVGQANDFVGKGLSGGELVLRGQGNAARESGAHTILGNVALYGATAGRLFAAGRGGERFAVRNSGADAVIEGVGDHGCEYMTGGTVAVLGRAGINFAAGMTGGLAWVYDADGSFVGEGRFHPEFVEAEGFAAVDAAGQAGLRALVERHQAATGSALAGAMLAGWAAEAGRFVRLSPKAQV